MKSATRGKSTSGTEVTNISGHGFWLLMADEELFVSFKKFPLVQRCICIRDPERRVAATSSSVLAWS